MAFKMKGFEPYNKVKGNNKPDGKAGSSAFQKSARKEQRIAKRTQKKSDKIYAKEARAREREKTGISRAEQFARRVEDKGTELANTRVGRLTRGAIKLATDAKNTDVGRTISTVRKASKGNLKGAVEGYRELSNQVRNRRNQK